tara:strand:+ start:490 stop:939 length:450 start_codon:yes stop_codon:yes gene_type:complete
MATVINGTNMVLKIDDDTSPTQGGATTIAAATSCTVNVTIDMGEVTDKDSGDRKEFIGIGSSWTMDAEVFYNEDGGKNPTTIFPAAYGDANASQNGVVQYPREVYVDFDAGSNEFHGKGYITSLSISGGTEDAGTYSISVQGTGDLTMA